MATVLLAQLDDLSPPPGYIGPNGSGRHQPRTPSDESPKPEVRGESIVFADPAGDLRQGRTETYLDLREVTLERLSDTLLSVNITFAEPMPGDFDENRYAIIFFSLDLDENTRTGKLFDKLGIDLGIKLKGYSIDAPWESTVTEHTEFAAEYGISVARISYSGQTLNLVLRTEGARKLNRFGLQIGAMANYRSVDAMPNKPPVYIDLSQLR